jgi:glycosyltransferase involved in cell wall biosynthesis
MNARPIAYVMEQTLGSVTHYQNLRREESASAEPLPRWIEIDYRPGRLPWTVTASLLARRALGAVLNEVDGIFLHTTTLAPLCVDYFRRKPAIISSDGTPLNKRGVRQAYGLRNEGRLSENAKRALYRRVFGAAAGLVAWSNWTKQSFVEDYGYPEEAVAVIPPGIDLNSFAIGDRDHELPRILFVGADFERKGGDLLIDVFQKRLRGKAELTLVTRAAVQDQPGVRILRDIRANSAELHDLYRTSDLFVLPTRADCYPLVCMEALAAGLPIVATRVGGIPDMVQEGVTGHLVDVDDGAALGDALTSLASEPGRRRAMAERCRADAVERFDARQNARRLFEFVRSRC